MRFSTSEAARAGKADVNGLLSFPRMATFMESAASSGTGMLTGPTLERVRGKWLAIVLMQMVFLLPFAFLTPSHAQSVHHAHCMQPGTQSEMAMSHQATVAHSHRCHAYSGSDAAGQCCHPGTCWESSVLAEPLPFSRERTALLLKTDAYTWAAFLHPPGLTAPPALPPPREIF
ncbi:hypothetical protein [Acetobacter sp.]|uniref:hypothetical protein n=1 Tax=Acetobacter sp. TaxID=440 RepID=UPI0039EAE261